MASSDGHLLKLRARMVPVLGAEAGPEFSLVTDFCRIGALVAFGLLLLSSCGGLFPYKVIPGLFYSRQV